MSRLIRVAILASGLSFSAAAQEGQYEDNYAVGHDNWHESFYSKLIRKDTKTSCCNLTDCRPTQARVAGDHYEVKVEGNWTSVPKEAVQNIMPPDGGAHVCAPKQQGTNRVSFIASCYRPKRSDRISMRLKYAFGRRSSPFNGRRA